MKIKLSVFNFSMIAALVFTFAVSGAAQTLDISMRNTVYVTNKFDKKIEPNTDPHADNGMTVNVSAAIAAGTATDGSYSFFLGVFVNREGGDLTKGFSTKATCKVSGSGYTDIQEPGFGPKTQSVPVFFHAFLRPGNNQVTIELDPGNAHPESNETNNKLTVNIVLKTAPPIKKNKVDYSTTNVVYLLTNKELTPGKTPHVNTLEDRQLKPGQANSLGLKDGMKDTCSFSKTDPNIGGCKYRIGVISKRFWQTEGTGPATTIKISVDNNPQWIYADNVNMGPYMTDKDFVILQQLDFGLHTIKVVIDPLKMVDEKDENNNSFTVTVNVHK